MRKSWNATHFMKGDRSKNSQDAGLQTLWAEDRFATLDLKTSPIIELSWDRGFWWVGRAEGCPTGG